MRPTLHAIVSGILAVLALAVAVPVLLDSAAARPIPTDKLSVATDEVRKPLATADHAIGPVVQSFSGLTLGNPFAPPSKERRANTPVPEPPPPPFDLPEPPPTPFVPGG